MGASADDAEESNLLTVSITSNPLINCDRDNQWNAWLFRGITIPAGATITAAYMTVRFSDGTLDEPDVTFWGLDIATPGIFVATDANISARTRTTASVNWANTNAGTADINTPSLVSIISELYASYGPYSSGVIGICMRSRAFNTIRDTSVISYDGSTTACARLTIQYLS